MTEGSSQNATLAVPAVIWPVLIAAVASTARTTLASRSLRSVLAG